MNFSSNTSLVHKASIAVISSLWNQQNVILDIKKMVLGVPDCGAWKSIERNVISVLHEIVMPNELKLMLLDLVQPMGMQLFNWIRLTRPIFQTSSFPDSINFIWTERGTIDYCKTAEIIIKSNSNKFLCFSLACTFCIEETIFKFWPDVGAILHERISLELAALGLKAVVYWTYNLYGKIENLMALTEYSGVKNCYEFGFLFLLDSKCVPSLSYFLKFIEPERKQKVLFLALRNIFETGRRSDGNLLLFLFSHLTEHEVNQLVKENCYCVLSSFLEWPCQEFFMTMVNTSWSQQTNFKYFILLTDLVEFVSKYYQSSIYKALFKQFWESSPLPFRQYVKHKCISGTFLSRLFMFGNTDRIIQIIFNDCTADERQQMIFYFEGMNLCDFLVKKERWDSLELLVKNCIKDQCTLHEFMKQYKDSKHFICDKDHECRTNDLFEKIKKWY